MYTMNTAMLQVCSSVLSYPFSSLKVLSAETSHQKDIVCYFYLSPHSWMEAVGQLCCPCARAVLQLWLCKCHTVFLLRLV